MKPVQCSQWCRTTFNSRPTLVANSFYNTSQLKPRIQMLYQSRNTHRILWRYALALPLLALLFGLTAAREQLAETLAIQPGPKNTVSGRVVDEADKPVRATVVVAGETRRTETDASGYFKLANVSGSTKLAINSVGFETQFVVVMDNKPATIMLKRKQQVLNEVVVTGYDDGPKRTPSGNEVFTVVEQNPEFPGGMAALGQYLSRSIRYPTEARQQHTSGMVFVQFVVGTDGAIQSPRILKGIGSGCDEEAVRVVSQMPKWKPGLQSGIPVSVQFNLPIRFYVDVLTSQGEPSNVDTSQRSGAPTNLSTPQSLTGMSTQTVVMPNRAFSYEKPLFILDGEELTKGYDLNKINPNEIQSINVLKGSSAQEKYGEKGTNGVIEITTKAKKP